MERKPNKWSCAATAFANVIGKPTTFIWDVVGHDGSKIIDSTLPEPFCREGISMEEIILALAKIGHYFIRFDNRIMIGNIHTGPYKELNQVEEAVNHFKNGVATISNSHCVSVIDGELIDPDNLQIIHKPIESFFAYCV